MLKFRNLTVTPHDPVSVWGVEGIATAIDRGDSHDWKRIWVAIENEPFGEVALDLEQALEVAQSPGITALFRRHLEYVRLPNKIKAAREFERLVRETCMSRAELAHALGTSASRLSSWTTGKVSPSAETVFIVRTIGRKRRDALAP